MRLHNDCDVIKPGLTQELASDKLFRKPELDLNWLELKGHERVDLISISELKT